jgi:hypothetical protein
VSVAVKKRELESNSNHSSTLQVTQTFPSFPCPRLPENHAQITSDIDGKQNGNTYMGPTSCSSLNPCNYNLQCIDEFFYDDPNEPYRPLPEHTLEQSQCYTIIGKKGNFYYCKLHPEVKNIYLETIEHHIKYKDRDMHKSEILKAMSDVVTHSYLL